MSESAEKSEVPITVKSWDEVWEIARKQDASHYNYSRGKVRFRGILSDPEEIGTASSIPPNSTVRIRLYKEDIEDWIELHEFDFYLRIPSDYALELPENFDGLGPAERTQVVLAQMHKLSALRWQRQADASEKILWAYITHLEKTIEVKDKLIAALQKKSDDLMANRGINTLYDFLVHPNADRAIASISTALASGRRVDSDESTMKAVMERIVANPEMRAALEKMIGRAPGK